MSTNDRPDIIGTGESFLCMQEGQVEEHELQWDCPVETFSNIGNGRSNTTTIEIKFKSGIFAYRNHQLKLIIYRNPYQSFAHGYTRFKLEVDGYNKETDIFILADGRTQCLSLHKAQADLYWKGKVVHSENYCMNGPHLPFMFLVIYMHNSNEAASGLEPFTCDMVRHRLFLRVETSSGENRFRTSALDAPDMFLSEKLSDIKVVCFDESKTETSFPAHRFVLSYNSPVFARMIQSDMKEAREGQILIKDMNPASLKELLRFMYTGTFVITDSFMFDMYTASEKYDIGSLKRQCRDYLKRRLSIHNAVDVYVLGEFYGCSMLKLASFQFIEKYKCTIMDSEKNVVEVGKKSPELLYKLFHSNNACDCKKNIN